MTLLDKVIAKTEIPNLVELLSERLSGAELSTLMLAVSQRKAAAKSPADLLRQYQQDRFIAPSSLNPTRIQAFDHLAFAMLTPAFHPLELAPLCPLGTNAVIATCSQNKVVSTMRDTEVMADSTAVLALEMARRRRSVPQRERQTERLCASHRLTRAQAYDNPALSAHFRLLALVSGGRDSGSWNFECTSLWEQLHFYLNFFARAPEIGLYFQKPQVKLTPLPAGIPEATVAQRVIAPLSLEHPQTSITFNPGRQQGRNYYQTLCFQIEAETSQGQNFMLVDGGFTNWTQALLSDHKERLLTSGIGTELACKLFTR